MADSGRFSIIPARAFDDTRLGAAPLKLLGLLGCYSNRDGWCWPSIAVLAKRMGVESRQAIQKHLTVLIDAGYVRRQRQVGGVNQYRILHDVDLQPEFDRMAEYEPANLSVACQPDGGGDANLSVAPPPSELGGGCQPERGIELTQESKNQESPLESPQGEPKQRKRATQWPEGLCLTPKLREYATRKAPGCDVARMWEQFENHHRAKGSMFIDWERAWYKWAGSQYAKPMNGQGQHHQPQRKRRNLLDEGPAVQSDLDPGNPESERSYQ